MLALVFRTRFTRIMYSWEATLSLIKSILTERLRPRQFSKRGCAVKIFKRVLIAALVLAVGFLLYVDVKQAQVISTNAI